MNKKMSKARKQKHINEECVRAPLYKRIWDFCVDTGFIGAAVGLLIFYVISVFGPKGSKVLDEKGVTVEAVVFNAELQDNLYGYKRHVKAFYHYNGKYIERTFHIYPKDGTNRISYVAVGDTIYLRILPSNPETGPIRFIYNKTKNIW